MGFIPGVQGWYNIRKSTNEVHHIDRLKKKNHMTTSTDDEKAFDKIQHPFKMIIISLSVLGTRGNFFNLIKNIYKSPTVSITLNGEKLESSPLSSTGTRK
jgi:hypothetical protein